MLELEHLLQARADLLMRQELPAVELLKTGRHFLTEPNIVIEVLFHKPLYVFVSTAVQIRGNTVKLRLQFRAKVHFHDLSVREAATAVKSATDGRNEDVVSL